MKDQAEILFQQEIHSKKNDMKNLRSKTGSRGGSGSRKGVRTAYDYMSNKERKKLSGEVSVKNLFDLLLSRKDFDQYPVDKQKEIMIRWRDIYPNSKIMEALEIKSQGTFNSFLQKLEVPKKRSWKQGTKKEKPQTARKEIQQENTHEVVSAVALPIEKDPNILILDGLHLNYNGEYSSEALARIFTKLQLIIEGEEIKYKVSISLQEV